MNYYKQHFYSLGMALNLIFDRGFLEENKSVLKDRLFWNNNLFVIFVHMSCWKIGICSLLALLLLESGESEHKTFIQLFNKTYFDNISLKI